VVNREENDNDASNAVDGKEKKVTMTLVTWTSDDDAGSEEDAVMTICSFLK